MTNINKEFFRLLRERKRHKRIEYQIRRARKNNIKSKKMDKILRKALTILKETLPK